MYTSILKYPARLTLVNMYMYNIAVSHPRTHFRLPSPKPKIIGRSISISNKRSVLKALSISIPIPARSLIYSSMSSISSAGGVVCGNGLVGICG